MLGFCRAKFSSVVCVCVRVYFCFKILVHPWSIFFDMKIAPALTNLIREGSGLHAIIKFNEGLRFNLINRYSLAFLFLSSVCFIRDCSVSLLRFSLKLFNIIK